MTREEAIKILESTVFTNDFSPSTIRAKELNRISIEALKQPEIIYCKDCKFSRQSMIGGELDCEFYIINGISKRFTTKCNDDYCSYAERKDD